MYLALVRGTGHQLGLSLATFERHWNIFSTLQQCLEVIATSSDNLSIGNVLDNQNIFENLGNMQTKTSCIRPRKSWQVYQVSERNNYCGVKYNSGGAVV